MEIKLKKMFFVIGMMAKIILVLVLNLEKGVIGKPQVPCMFIFGDSLVDNGNNNGLDTIAKANYFPYGIDFPEGPVGRFNNGKTPTDVISELLGFDDYILPYSLAKGQEILRGVNYASAAGGIRSETGYQLGGRYNLAEQVDHYKATVYQIHSILGGPKSAANHLRKCLFSINIGSNDYINNYFMPIYYSSSKHFTPQQFAQLLIQQYAQQIRVLYRFGARKFGLAGIGQIGCCPHTLAESSPDGKTCVAKINIAIQQYNYNLKAMVHNFNMEFHDANFTYIDVYSIFQELINHPEAHAGKVRPHRLVRSYIGITLSATSLGGQSVNSTVTLDEAVGFTVVNTACCGLGKNGALFTCLPLQIPCVNRSEYLFWDAFHPTEAANIIIGRTSYNPLKPTDVYPFDIRSLARM